VGKGKPKKRKKTQSETAQTDTNTADKPERTFLPSLLSDFVQVVQSISSDNGSLSLSLSLFSIHLSSLSLIL
jgi:hypothetical protein